jgi:methyltransferase (TIGR00027 family)
MESHEGARGASRTAVMVAAYRGRATLRGDGLCDDRWAAALAGDEGLAFAARYDTAFAYIELWLALRTCVLDAQVRARIEDGVRQVVILGAGLDTRAARLASSGVRFFEVDHPASQADKRARLARLADYPIDAAAYVACDFEQQDFLDVLVAAGFVPTAPSLFLWEGVTYYLPEAAVRATLSRIAKGAAPRSIVAFDYVRKRFVQGEMKDPKDHEARDRVAEMGEPLRFGTDDVLPLLHDVGFRRVRTASFDELCLNFTGTYERARKFRFQQLAIASVGASRLGCDGLP